jgi:hypothetical protein
VTSAAKEGVAYSKSICRLARFHFPLDKESELLMQKQILRCDAWSWS